MIVPNFQYSALLLIAGMACLTVALVVWQERRTAAGAGALIVLMVALGWWDVTYALFWAGAWQPVPFFWLDITYLGVVVVPTAFLAFVLQLTQLGHWLKPPAILALALEPLFSLALMWTDPWHGLFFAGKRDLNTTMILDAGPMFWINVGYSYLLILAGCILLGRHFLRSSGLYRRQAAMVLGAAAITWLGSLVFLFGLSPLPNADSTPFGFSLSALAFAFALLRYRLLDVVPIARHVLVENMSDGVMVLDAQNRVVDLNPAALNMINSPLSSPIGEPVERVLSAQADLVSTFRDVNLAHAEIALRGPSDRHLDLRISPLLDGRQIVGRLVVWRDITELKLAQRELQKLATTDPLTQVFNRRYFFERAGELIQAQHLDRPLAMVLIDIDHFKQVNDALGHAAGDRVLTTFADLCRKMIREVDLFARLGGEEFVWLMPDTDAEQARQAAEQVRLATTRLLVEVGENQIPITISSGVAAWAGPHDTLESILHRADLALYAAKEAGRNRVVVWEDPAVPLRHSKQVECL